MEAEGGDDTINIVIKTINNDVYNIPVTNSTPIHRLKDAIRETTTIDIDRQRLIYRGKVLTDESVVRDYNIEDGHTVHMVARPPNYREIQQSVNSPPPPPAAPSRAMSEPVTGRSRDIFSLLGGAAAIPGAARSANIARGGENNDPATSVNPSTSSSTNPPPEPSIEHIRQGLLTMHTLFSTINTVRIPSSSSSRIAESKTEEVRAESKPSANDATTSANSPLTSERRFFIGQWLDVKDTVSQWLEATVLDIDVNNHRIFVHYNGWPQRWDEWIAFDSPRVAPFRSRTNHAALSANLSPSPNISVAHAPSTGMNDLRLVLPELANLFRMLQPVVEELGQLSEESLRYNRPTVPPDARYATDLPWNEYLQPTSVIPPTTSQVGEEKYMDLVPDSKDTPITPSPAETNRQYRTQEEVDARLQLIARDACPLFDRFGRVLSDLSPHLWTRAMPGINRPIPANRFDPFQSLESRLLSLLRERPPSPPPIQAYRAPITSQAPRLEPIDMLRSGILRAAPISGNEESDINTTASNEGSVRTSNSNGVGSGSNTAPGGRRSGLEHHVDIHIAIVSPPTTNRTNVDSLSRTVANLTASLQAQAQHLAARTQELSERTSAVSEITSAITEALRSSNGLNNGNNSTETQTSPSIANGEGEGEVDEEVEEILEGMEGNEGENDGDDDSVPSLTDNSEESARNEPSLDDLNVSSTEEEHANNSLMPSNEEQREQQPFYNIPNQSLQANYGTVTSPETITNPNPSQSNYNANEQTSTTETNEGEGDNVEDPTEASRSSTSASSRSFLQRLRRSFFSSR